jgi:hypothetical protein
MLPRRRCACRPRTLALTWLLCAATTGNATSLQAQPLAANPAALGLPLEVDACVPVDEASFRRQLAIELEAAPQASDLARAQPTTRIALGCEREQITLAVTDANARKTWRRLIALRSVDPRAQTRLLALSVAELLLASWLELRIDAQPRARPEREPETSPPPGPATVRASGTELTDDSAATTAQPMRTPAQAQSLDSARGQALTSSAAPVRPTPPEPTANRLSVLQLGAAADALAFTSSLALIAGGELHVTMPLAKSWALRAAAQAGHGNLSGAVLGELGSKTHVQITAASLALSLHAFTRSGDFELGLGAGIRLGLVQLAGQQVDRMLVPVRTFAPWTGPLLSPSVSYRLTAGLRARLDLEAGFLVVNVRALAPKDALVTELHGLWVRLSIGLEIAFFP